MDKVAFALADPVRRQILEALAVCPRTAGALADQFPISRPAVSRHLRVLRESGMVLDRVEGRNRVYTLCADPLRELIDWSNRLVNPARRMPDLDALATEVHRASRDRRQREQWQEDIA